MLSQHDRNDYPAITKKVSAQIVDFPVLNITIKFPGSEVNPLNLVSAKGAVTGHSHKTTEHYGSC